MKSLEEPLPTSRKASASTAAATAKVTPILITLGALALVCDNKACETRSSSSKKVNLTKVKQPKGKIIKLCQGCLKAWNNGQYCYYCCSIYKDNNINANVDGKSWICCDLCSSWVPIYSLTLLKHHILCEEKKGEYTNLKKSLLNPNFKYFCPHCKNRNSDHSKRKNKRRVNRIQSINCNQPFIYFRLRKEI